MDAPLQDRRAARNTGPRDVAADDANAHRSTMAQEPSIEVWDGQAIERTHVRRDSRMVETEFGEVVSPREGAQAHPPVTLRRHHRAEPAAARRSLLSFVT